MDKPLIIDTPLPGVRLLTLNRPDRRNALATALLAEVGAALGEAAADPDIRVAVVTGGPTLFAAGADLGEMARTGAGEPIDAPRFLAWQAVRACPLPTVAAVEGWCLGAGLELAMACDLIVAGAGARLGQPETNLGIIPGGGATALLPRLVGRVLATRMILTGEPIGADEALAAGLVAEVAPAGEALAHAMALAAKLAARAPLALAAAKASIRDADTLPLADQLREERRRHVALLGTADKAEGVAAFLEKRQPRWTGA